MSSFENRRRKRLRRSGKRVGGRGERNHSGRVQEEEWRGESRLVESKRGRRMDEKRNYSQWRKDQKCRKGGRKEIIVFNNERKVPYKLCKGGGGWA
jgi:hypothetical protein